ncbi:MAG TPA: M28 family peptidase [Allosphingosinicella sp.]|jgi:Zn-dependent M28 family amino/carboxypeptidase
MPIRPILLLVLLAAAPAAAERDAPVTPTDMMRHIDILASDAFEGRAPATEGERRTTAYIAAELARRGLEPAGADGSWYQQVALMQRRAERHHARWTTNGRQLGFDDTRITLIGSRAEQRISDASVVFVGHGFVDRARGIDQLAGADLAGAVALILVEPPDVAGFPPYEDRVRAVAQAGAAAVIGIVADDVPWRLLLEAGANGRVEREDGIPAISGTIGAGEVARLLAEAGGDFAALLDERPGPSFRAVPLNLRASFEVTSDVRRYSSNNVVGRIRGTGGGQESVLLLGHWDHLGLCRPEGEADRICNGAVDNASGIAMLIEAAGRLAARRPARDVLILATTSEEDGLLGAEHFAAHPVVPIASIVAAINMDTVAIHGRGEPVAVVGRGIAPLDQAIADAAASLGRRIDETHAADTFLRRQDGYALARAGVPSVMVGGSFANMALLNAFLAGAYHAPDDEAGPDLPLEGAAEDADLLVALARRLADPARYQPPRTR